MPDAAASGMRHSNKYLLNELEKWVQFCGKARKSEPTPNFSE